MSRIAHMLWGQLSNAGLQMARTALYKAIAMAVVGALIGFLKNPSVGDVIASWGAGAIVVVQLVEGLLAKFIGSTPISAAKKPE